MTLSDLWNLKRTSDSLDRSNPGRLQAKANLGRTIAGIYTLESVIQEGGMGFIYLAIHRKTGRKMVIKLIREDRLNEDFVNLSKRFFREADAMARMNHPNIVTLYDFNFSNPAQAYIAMEYIEGVTLRRYLDKNPQGIPLVLFMSFMEQLCSAVDMFHQKGIVHRDLKPVNIMVTHYGASYTIKILDLGLIFFEGTMSPSSRDKLTRKGELIGTPAYMSPEQCLGLEITHLADIYNLGLIAYELLAGRRPFEGRHLQEMLDKQLKAKAEPLQRIRTEIPAHVVAAIARAMSKNPSLRFDSALAFWKALFGN